jgi:hypothetical protein
MVMLAFTFCVRIPWRILSRGGFVVIYLVSAYHGRLLLLHLFWMTALLGRVSWGWSYFHSVSRRTHTMLFLLFMFLLRSLLWFWWVYLCKLLVFSLLQPWIFFLYTLCLLFQW